MWTVYAERFEDSDFAGSPRIYQPFRLQRFTKVKALRMWFVAYGAPSFGELGVRIYNGANGVPTSLRATFDKTWQLSEILSVENYGLKELWFDFDNPHWLAAGTEYFIVPFITTPAFTPTSHMAWVRGFPDPNTDIEVVTELVNIFRMPFYMALIGAEP